MNTEHYFLWLLHFACSFQILHTVAGTVQLDKRIFVTQAHKHWRPLEFERLTCKNYLGQNVSFRIMTPVEQSKFFLTLYIDVNCEQYLFSSFDHFQLLPYSHLKQACVHILFLFLYYLFLFLSCFVKEQTLMCYLSYWLTFISQLYYIISILFLFTMERTEFKWLQCY